VLSVDLGPVTQLGYSHYDALLMSYCIHMLLSVATSTINVGANVHDNLISSKILKGDMQRFFTKLVKSSL